MRLNATYITIPENKKSTKDYAEHKNLIDLSIGSPRHATPLSIKKIIDDNFDKYASYPPAKASNYFGENISHWLKERYKINKIESEDNILPISGSREGLFYASLLATKIKEDRSIFISVSYTHLTLPTILLV